MESNESRLARLETKVDYITKQLDTLVSTLACKDKDCASCKAEIVEKIVKVESTAKESHNILSTRVALLIAAITASGTGLGTYISKVLGLI